MSIENKEFFENDITTHTHTPKLGFNLSIQTSGLNLNFNNDDYYSDISTNISTNVSTNNSAHNSASNLHLQSEKQEILFKKVQDKHFKKYKRSFEIDTIGNGEFSISQFNLLQKKSFGNTAKNEHEQNLNNLNKALVEVRRKPPEPLQKQLLNATSTITILTTNNRVKTVPQSLFIDAYFTRAKIYEKMNILDKAIDDYSMIINLNKTLANAYFCRSNIYISKKMFKLAHDDLNKAIDLEPNNVDFLSNRVLLFRQEGLYYEASDDAVKCNIVKKSIFNKIVNDNNSNSKNDHNLNISFSPTDKGIDTKSLRRSQILQMGVLSDVSLSKNFEDPILKSLSIPTDCRSSKDLIPIIDFVKTFQFFSTFSTDIELVTRIASKLELRSYNANRIVFEEGQSGFHFFIILEGEIAIIKTRMKIIENEVLSEKVELVRLKTGKYFGETALESAEGLRTATAIATKPTNLLLLHAKDYQSILSQFKSKFKTEVMKALISSSSLFKYWDHDKLEQLATFATVRSYAANTDIIRTGDFVNSLMVIKSGIVTLVKKLPTEALRLEEELNKKKDSTFLKLSSNGNNNKNNNNNNKHNKSNSNRASKSSSRNSQTFDHLPMITEHNNKINKIISSYSSPQARSPLSAPSSAKSLKRPNSMKIEKEDSGDYGESRGQLKRMNSATKLPRPKTLQILLDKKLDLTKQHSFSRILGLISPNSAMNVNSFRIDPVGDTNRIKPQTELTIAVLMSGQYFGELAVLDQYELSPITAIATTPTELYCFQNDFLVKLGINEDEEIIATLKESWKESNPSANVMEARYREKYLWELKKLEDGDLKYLTHKR
eukprot:gene5473-7578_t